MQVFEMVVLLVAIGGLTTVISKYLERNKAPDFDQRMGTADDSNPISEERLAKLEERVAVLEKIVTDRSYDLKREFENL